MSKKVTNEDFINRSIKIHKGKYTYERTNYIGSRFKVIITCPIHGDFEQRAADHLQGKGCKKCGCSKNDGLVCGFGINDLNDINHPAYNTWKRIIERCYSGRKAYSRYQDCSVCDEWKYYSNFKKWFETSDYQEGYDIDKDILSSDCKVYSPDTCCFVPHEINSLIIKANKIRGEYPIGVNYDKDKNKYRASISINNTYKFIGRYNTPEEAFLAYKEYKENYIKELANKYYSEGNISEKVYKGLLNYTISIDD